jgi:biotin transport system substrate-specific component
VERYLRILGGACLTAACARVSFDLPGDVPLTGQTFGVLVAGGVLGPWDGALSQAVYVAASARRVPGPTGGFLLSFPAAAWVTGRLGVVAGSAVPFAVGVPWLARRVGWREAVASGLIPFLPGAVVKGAGAAWLVRRCAE